MLSLRGGAGSTGNLIQRKPESKNKRTLQNRARSAKKVLLKAISQINGGRDPEDLKDEEVADKLRHLLTRTRVGKNFCADFDKALLSTGSHKGRQLRVHAGVRGSALRQRPSGCLREHRQRHLHEEHPPCRAHRGPHEARARHLAALLCV